MEGLEISVVSINSLERTKRNDAEFYRKANLAIEKRLLNSNSKSLNSYVDISDGNHMSIKEKFIEKGIPYYRGQDIHSYFIEHSNPICIDDDTFNEPNMVRSHLKGGDVLLSIVGTIGKLSLVKTNRSQTCSCKLAILRPKAVNPEFISTYLSSKYGQNQIKKFTRGAVQMGLVLEDLDQLFVPTMSDDFQLTIKEIVDNSFTKLQQSKSLYTEAENILLEELGLLHWKPTRQSYSTKSYAESYQVSGRLDAEYYQPKYDEIENKIKSGKHSIVLNEFEILRSKNFEYNQEGEVGVIKTKQVKRGSTLNFDVDDSVTIEILKSEKLNILINNDIVFASMGRGSLGKASIFYDFQTERNFTIDSTLRIFRKRKDSVIKPEVAFVWINSTVCYEMILRYEIGSTGITSMYEEDIKNLLIPILPETTQSQIAAKIQQSFMLQQQSKQLLEAAKTAVEIAIEQDEAAALEYLSTYL